MNDPKNPETVMRTPNPDCQACKELRIHEPIYKAVYHRFSGHGYNKELGWTHPDLARGAKER